MAEMESALNFGGEEFKLETQKITASRARTTQAAGRDFPKMDVPAYDWSPHLFPGESLLKPELHSIFLKTGKKGEKSKVSHFTLSTLRILLLLVCTKRNSECEKVMSKGKGQEGNKESSLTLGRRACGEERWQEVNY
jgi:hypothetical protein